MPSTIDATSLLFPKTLDWEMWKQYKNDTPFSGKVISFLDALSLSLLKDSSNRGFPDVITFAFFCRKANILSLKEQYGKEGLKLGRGIVFHIAPSNVPINFAYSLVSGLLSGNYNVLRVSSREFPQVDLIIKHLEQIALLDGHREVAERIVLLRYNKNSNVTNYLSSLCNVRIIWGGDETIAQIRKSTLKSRAFDITFADRYSFALINADGLIKDFAISKIAEGFYNDTYLFDQNACSAPHLIVWLGNRENIRNAQKVFWDAVFEEVKKKYDFQSVLAIDKLTAFYRQTQAMPVHLEKTPDNTLVRVSLETLPENIDEFRCAGGYFSEYIAASLDNIVPIINEKYQTMAYYGYDKKTLQEFVVTNHLTGIDRIVPIGSTTDFSLTWDGYDLVTALSRECCVR
jgi:hypothetical protein